MEKPVTSKVKDDKIAISNSITVRRKSTSEKRACDVVFSVAL